MGFPAPVSPGSSESLPAGASPWSSAGGGGAPSSCRRSTRGTYKAWSGLRPRCHRPALAPRRPAAAPWLAVGRGPRYLLGWEAGGRQEPENPSELGNLEQEQALIRGVLEPRGEWFIGVICHSGLRLLSQSQAKTKATVTLENNLMRPSEGRLDALNKHKAVNSSSSVINRL